MKKQYLLSLLIFTTVLSGCGGSVVNNWEATGGSRADATIKLSHHYGFGSQIQVTEQQAIDLAVRRCAIWGYSGAEAFGGEITTCNQMDRYLGCIDGIVTKEYQCTGQGNEIQSKPIQPNTYYQQSPTPYNLNAPQQQLTKQPIQPVAEQNAPTYQTYQQPQVEHSGKDLRDCLALVDNAAIARCVKGK